MYLEERHFRILESLLAEATVAYNGFCERSWHNVEDWLPTSRRFMSVRTHQRCVTICAKRLSTSGVAQIREAHQKESRYQKAVN